LAPMLQERLSRRVRRQLLRILRAILSMLGRWSSCIRWSVRCAGLGRRLCQFVGVEGVGAGPDIIGPSQTYDAPASQSQDDPFTPAPPPPRPHRAPNALTYSEGHIRRRLRTRGEDQESARTGTGGVDTPDSVDSVYLNCFLYDTILFLMG
jgi:hypothetical protein